MQFDELDIDIELLFLVHVMRQYLYYFFFFAGSQVYKL